MLLFYCFNAIFHFAFASEPATAVGIAVIHSSFNIAAAIIFTPVSSIFEKMAYLTIDNPKVTVTTKFWKIRTGVKLRSCQIRDPDPGYPFPEHTGICSGAV